MAKRKCKNCREMVESTAAFCPLCGMKFKKKNIFLFSVLMIFLFIFVMELLFPVSYVLFNHGITLGKYGEDAIAELFLVFFIVIILFMSGNSYVFSEKKIGFFRSLLLGLPILIFSGFIFLTAIPDAISDFNFANFVSLLFLCVFVGLAEEFLCRAWLQNEFIERFGSSKRGIIISIILSSFVFGFMHITNALNTTQGLFETFMQIFQALASGFLFGSIYYKTKNIWSVAFIHGFFDFALMVSSVNVLKDCVNSYTDSSAVIISAVSSLFIMAFYIFIGLFALSSKKGYQFFKKNNVPLIVSIVGMIASIILLIGSSVVESMLLGNVEGSICYSFEELKIKEEYNIVTSNRDAYTFTNGSIEYTLHMNDKDELELASNSNSVVFKYSGYLEDYLVVDNDDYVDIVIYYYDNESVIYHNRINRASFEDTEKYLKNIKNNMEKLDLPDLSYIGYIVFDNDNIKYPYMHSKTNTELFINVDNELYIIKK